jgi:hypothetical protein
MDRWMQTKEICKDRVGSTIKSIGPGTERIDSCVPDLSERGEIPPNLLSRTCIRIVFWIADVGEMIGFVSTHFVWAVNSNSILDSTSAYMERLYRGDVRTAMVIKIDGEYLFRNLSTPFLSSPTAIRPSLVYNA